MNSFINPYKLLGLDNNTSIEKLKQSYYSFALICHPDKGGKNDDMVTIHNAYLFIKNEINMIKKNQTDIEQLEDNFNSFCKTQESLCPEFNYIYKISNQLEYNTRFNNFYLEKKEKEEYNPYDSGYGDMMVESVINYENIPYVDISNNILKNIKINEINENIKKDENVEIYENIEIYEKDEYNENTEDIEKYEDIEIYDSTNNITDKYGMFNKQIIEYKGPICTPSYNSNCETLNKKKIIDFSSKSNNIVMTDYELAFSPQHKINISIVPKTMEDIIKEREANSIFN